MLHNSTHGTYVFGHFENVEKHRYQTSDSFDTHTIAMRIQLRLKIVGNVLEYLIVRILYTVPVLLALEKLRVRCTGLVH